MRRQAILIFLSAIFAFVSTNVSAKGHSGGLRPYYGGGRHTSSHDGYYAGGSGSSHKGGHYQNYRSGNRYGRHK